VQDSGADRSDFAREKFGKTEIVRCGSGKIIRCLLRKIKGANAWTPIVLFFGGQVW
jgi:hypothetical protein